MTFPIPADASTAVMLVGANTFSFVLVMVLTPLLAGPDYRSCSTTFTPAAWVTIACMLVGAVFTMFVKEEYVRSQAEQRRRRFSSSAARVGEYWEASAPDVGAHAPLLVQPANEAGAGTSYGAAV
jgi:hypothetical protein